jgi:hypothetical protein
MASQPHWYLQKRTALASGIATAVALYLAATILGYIPAEQRINTADLLVVVIAIVAVFLINKPDVMNRVKELEVAGLKLHLWELKQIQQEQNRNLEIMTRILPLLLPAPEQAHMKNLVAGSTSNYNGNNILQSELRNLRSIGIIRNRPDKLIADMAKGKVFDLADYVELTEQGKEWVGLLKTFDITSQTTEPRAHS